MLRTAFYGNISYHKGISTPQSFFSSARALQQLMDASCSKYTTGHIQSCTQCEGCPADHLADWRGVSLWLCYCNHFHKASISHNLCTVRNSDCIRAHLQVRLAQMGLCLQCHPSGLGDQLVQLLRYPPYHPSGLCCL